MKLGDVVLVRARGLHDQHVVYALSGGELHLWHVSSFLVCVCLERKLVPQSIILCVMTKLWDVVRVHVRGLRDQHVVCVVSGGELRLLHVSSFLVCVCLERKLVPPNQSYYMI